MHLKGLIIVLLLLLAGCAQKSPLKSKAAVPSPSDVNLNEASDSELLGHVGERMTLHGKWSLNGVVGPYIIVNNREIYVVPRGNFSWGKKYAQMQGKDVRVTGVLRYAHFEPSPNQHPPDHFYFEAETATVELNNSEPVKGDLKVTG